MYEKKVRLNNLEKHDLYQNLFWYLKIPAHEIHKNDTFAA